MNTSIIGFLKYFYDFFIPHWVIEDVALIYHGDEFEIMCCVNDLTDQDVYDGIATSRALVWLYWGFFATVNNFRDAAL